MIGECEDSLLRKFDMNQDYLWLWNAFKGKSGGILVGVLIERFDVGSFKQGDFMIQVNLWDKVNKVKWNLIVVYGAARDDLKVKFLAELSAFCSNNLDPVLIGGDFNIIRYANERNRQHGVQRFSDLFNSLIDFHELREIEMSRGMYTWSNNQEVLILERLDRILVSRDWEDLFPQVWVRKVPREVSDHNPLILSSGQHKINKTIQFNFEKRWLTNPEFISAAKKIWLKPCNAKSALDKIL